MTFTLADRPDFDGLAACYAQNRCVVISDFLPSDQAGQLAASLLRSTAWQQIFRAEEKVYEMPHEAFRALPQPQLEHLERLVFDAARNGLQYRYRSIRSPDPGTQEQGTEPILDAFAAFMNSAEVLDLMRAVTGDEAIALTDAQATLYEAGSFLTTHDDNVDAKHRSAAYVFGLTRGWRPDWGGLLLLEEDEAVRGFVPAFNTVRLFAVPQLHHVSLVAPWVKAERLSVTGWLRHAG